MLVLTRKDGEILMFPWPSGRRRIETLPRRLQRRLARSFRWPSGRRRIETRSKRPAGVRADATFPLAFGPAAD